MNSQWRDFLETRGARYGEDGLARFPDAPRQADPALSLEALEALPDPAAFTNEFS